MRGFKTATRKTFLPVTVYYHVCAYMATKNYFFLKLFFSSHVPSEFGQTVIC